MLAARLVAKPILRVAPGPETWRSHLHRLPTPTFFAPPLSLWLDRGLTPTCRALWVENRPASHPPAVDRIVLYLHGGGFIAGHAGFYRAMLARLSRLTRLTICAPDYRLAPEHPFPAAVEDAQAAFDALVARGYAPGNIVLAGDSAGGNLALGLMARLCEQDRRPAGVVCLSPVTDLTFSGASITGNARADPVFPPERRGDLARWYLAGADPTDPRASPLFAAFAAPPPVFLQFAGTEILSDDSRRMAAQLARAGGRVEVDEWPHAIHVWQVFDGLIPESRQALRRVAAFIDSLFRG